MVCGWVSVGFWVVCGGVWGLVLGWFEAELRPVSTFFTSLCSSFGGGFGRFRHWLSFFGGGGGGGVSFIHLLNLDNARPSTTTIKAKTIKHRAIRMPLNIQNSVSVNCIFLILLFILLKFKIIQQSNKFGLRVAVRFIISKRNVRKYTVATSQSVLTYIKYAFCRKVGL